MRIAVAGLHIECSTYNPVVTRAEHFTLMRGEGLLGNPHFGFLRDYPADYVPLLYGTAVPGGPVDRSAYEGWKAEVVEGLRSAGQLDGVYLAMHGAMFVEGMFDAEGDFITAVRDVVGPSVPIAASYDLHGNVSQAVIDGLDIFTTYRTAPHIDEEETRRRAVAMLHRCLNDGVRPHIVWAKVPVLLPGERTSTEDEPAKSLYASLPDVEAPEGIWDASFQVGYVWADEPRATAAAIVTGTDIGAMSKAAAGLAQRYWDARTQFDFGTTTGTLQECVQMAVTSPTGPVVLAESGDNPTGGGVGDRADVLAALLDAHAQDAVLAGITDKPATDMAYEAGVGGRIRLSIGGTLDPSSAPVAIAAEVVFLLETDDPMGREAVLRVEGVDLVVTARRRPFHNIADFTKLGLDPRKARIVVVKSGYLSPELAPIANPSLMALTPGVVDQDVARLERRHKTGPAFPWDRDFDWAPEVAVQASGR
ncbi:M81 family metallopeptidase [Cucumibacter marinus]|uniref:M81 family metallopeptidase n=1 Tax=Cucumibacter marinus TaxID=1121252 RepID=UPI00048CFD10|nr:M81 family metallopeptidase [Cucumibacter marinus]